MRTLHCLFAGLSVCGVLARPGLALDINDDPKPTDAFFAKGISFPVQHKEKVFPANEERGNFTFFNGVENVAVRDGTLSFTVTESQATLGWGNYAGKQPITEIRDMWQETNIVRLRVRQSGAQSKWTVRLWRDGSVLGAVAESTLSGKDWQEIEFKPLHSDGPNPDGLEFLIEGEQGAQVEIEWLKLVQPLHEGYCRYEFTLPEGQIWRAIADVGAKNRVVYQKFRERVSRLHINGRQVARRGAIGRFHTAPIDVAPYLRPGRNCIGFYGFGITGAPLLYFQARIVMANGDVITVASGTDWKYSLTDEDAWDQPGFDDSRWANTKPGYGLWTKRRDFADRPLVPAYSGRLALRNPARRDLFYVDSREAVAEVHAPVGLARRKPTLSYLLGKADVRGVCVPVKDGTVDAAETRGPSLVFGVNLGRLEHGVYVLASVLRAGDGSIIEERCREPLVVLRRVEQKRIAGSDYFEGLDVELEDSIDFTDPDDPHPWVEAARPISDKWDAIGELVEEVLEPNIVRRGGLVYREVVGVERSSGFSYRIEFKHPGSFYVLELEYPDDARRVIEVQVSTKAEGLWTNSQVGVGAETGGRFLPTNSMKTLRFIHVADPGPQSVEVLNARRGEPAAAKCLRFYRVKGNLPSVGAGSERSYGIHTERCHFGSGLAMNFGVGLAGRLKPLADENGVVNPMRVRLRELVWLKQAAERYVQYLRFTGQNCHVMGCIQYGDRNTPFIPATNCGDSRVLQCPRTMLANVLEANSIGFFAGLQFCGQWAVRTFANNAQVANGADTVWLVNNRGEQRYFSWMDTAKIQNWLHPGVRDAFLGTVADLRETFGHLRHFLGVHAFLTPGGKKQDGIYWPGISRHTRFDPFETSFDDATMRLLQDETGFVGALAGSLAPDRFEKRAGVLKQPGIRDVFLEWRRGKLTALYADTARALRRDRDDLRFVTTLRLILPDFYEHLAASKRPFKQALGDLAVDLPALNGTPGLCVAR